MKTFFKSTGAAFAGILVGAGLSLGTDALLENMGMLPHGTLWVSNGLIVFVLFYRTVYNIIGSYLVARLAPFSPMKHALVVGALGTLVSIFGAIATKNMNLGPEWYAWTLAALTLPSAYLGAKIYLKAER